MPTDTLSFPPVSTEWFAHHPKPTQGLDRVEAGFSFWKFLSASDSVLFLKDIFLNLLNESLECSLCYFHLLALNLNPRRYQSETTGNSIQFGHGFLLSHLAYIAPDFDKNLGEQIACVLGSVFFFHLDISLWVFHFFFLASWDHLKSVFSVPQWWSNDQAKSRLSASCPEPRFGTYAPEQKRLQNQRVSTRFSLLYNPIPCSPCCINTFLMPLNIREF